jgi:hypothetical protein
MLFLVDIITRFVRTAGAWPNVEWRTTSSHFGPCGHSDFERVRGGQLGHSRRREVLPLRKAAYLDSESKTTGEVHDRSPVTEAAVEAP